MSQTTYTTVLDMRTLYDVPVAVNPARAFDRENLAPLCVDCHRRVTSLEKSKGRDTERLFDNWRRIPAPLE